MAILAAVVAMVVVLVGLAVLDDDSSPEPTTEDAVDDTTCVDLHTGHNLMSWDPTMADEMAARDCGWPYEPFVSPGEGGEPQARFDDAPFEPRLYDELWTMLGDLGVGVCSVGTLPDPPADGFAFGFRYALAEPGCTGAQPLADLVVREYATRGQRDAAATEEPDGAVRVLGRWVLTVDGEADIAGAVDGGLGELGGIDAS